MIDPGYYVTVRDSGRTGFLAGPYDTHEDALAKVDAVRDKAVEVHAPAWFYLFGTTRVKAPIALKRGGVTFGKM